VQLTACLSAKQPTYGCSAFYPEHGRLSKLFEVIRCRFYRLYYAIEWLWKVKWTNCSDRTKVAAVYEKLIQKLHEVDPEENCDSVIRN
jgi:hypothetical protein